MGARLIIVSNRVAVPDPGGKPSPGGMAVAVKAALKHRTGMWFGWSGEVQDATSSEPRIIERKGITFAVIDITNHDFQEYYNGFANRVLWPILHYRVDLAEYSRSDLSGYMRVNRLFADKLGELIKEDDVIWVHDYHLMPLARELRQRGHHNAIGFYLHIPCAPPDILTALPRHQQILGSLSFYDLAGFQTENDRDNFGQYLLTLGAQRNRDGLSYNLGGRALVLGVDRLDYSKGILHRINAFDRFLETNPDWRSRVTFLQITPRSRSDIQEYASIEEEVTALVGRINGRYGEASWTPIRYINRSYSRTALAGIYRAADVALVTPLRDGMNLVAKEFVAAQNSEDPGVLILSQFAGAAAELDQALIVNPHETEGVAAAIKRALEMPLAERLSRQQAMFAHLAANDIERWARTYLGTLAETRQRPGLLDGLRTLFGSLA